MMITRSAMALVALALVAVSCAAPAETAPTGSQVVAELSDYKITVSVPSVKAGKIKIGVRNLGNMEHSFQVLKTDLPPDNLPVLSRLRRRSVDGKLVRREVRLQHYEAVLHRAEVADADLDLAGFHARHIHCDLGVCELGDHL